MIVEVFHIKPQMLTLRKARESPKSLGCITRLSTGMSIHNDVTIHQKIIKIFVSGPKWWTNNQHSF